MDALEYPEDRIARLERELAAEREVRAALLRRLDLVEQIATTQVKRADRAIALLNKHHFCAPSQSRLGGICPECLFFKQDGHQGGCEWLMLTGKGHRPTELEERRS